MFYTAYEMFEGHRKRKWAWFPVSSWTLRQLLPLPLCFTHACINICPWRRASRAAEGYFVSFTGSQLPPWAPSLIRSYK